MKAAAIYVLAVIGANLTATLFIPFPVFGKVAVGSFLFGITFTQRDRFHYRGKRFVYGVILFTAVLNLLLLASYTTIWGPSVVRLLDVQGYHGLRDGMEDLLATSTRVFVASFVAIVISEGADTEVYHQLRDRSWMVRVMRSNILSIPLDTLIFNLIAFAGIFPPETLIAIVFGEVLVKFTAGGACAFLRARPQTVQRVGD